MLFPIHQPVYQVEGFSLRVLGAQHKQQMMHMQQEVLSALPDPRWYFPSEEWEFDSWLAGGEAVGYLQGDIIAGYAVITPWHIRGEHAYARVLGETAQDTFDFHDVMVRKAYRGRGMHTRFLQLFEQAVRDAGGRAVYATVDPGNSASWHNFEKAGYRCLLTQPAYDGRERRYYKLSL